jgi:hypothetical protein
MSLLVTEMRSHALSTMALVDCSLNRQTALAMSPMPPLA